MTDVGGNSLMAPNVYMKIGRKSLFPGSFLLARSCSDLLHWPCLQHLRYGGRHFYIQAFSDHMSRVPGMVLNEA